MLTPEQEGEIASLAIEMYKKNPAQTKEYQQTIFDTGASFHLAAKRCADPNTNSDGTKSAPISPTISCLSFACELYLKSIIPERRKSHHLYELFKKLHQNDKDCILEKYKTISNRDSKQFIIYIDKLSRAFEDWRYIFEQNLSAISIGILINIANCLYIHITSTHHDWVVKSDIHIELMELWPEDIIVAISIGSGVTLKATLKP